MFSVISVFRHGRRQRYSTFSGINKRAAALLETKQVAHWATIAHLGAGIMFGDTIIDDVQRQVTLTLKQ